MERVRRYGITGSVPSWAVAGVVLAAGSDPSSSRTVYGIVGALVVIGVLLIVVAIWVFRQTRVDPELLAPLETMSDRRWRRLDPASQRRMLDDERPEGAQPLNPSTSVPQPDAEFAADRPVTGFDDLKLATFDGDTWRDTTATDAHVDVQEPEGRSDVDDVAPAGDVVDDDDGAGRDPTVPSEAAVVDADDDVDDEAHADIDADADGDGAHADGTDSDGADGGADGDADADADGDVEVDVGPADGDVDAGDGGQRESALGDGAPASDVDEGRAAVVDADDGSADAAVATSTSAGWSDPDPASEPEPTER